MRSLLWQESVKKSFQRSSLLMELWERLLKKLLHKPSCSRNKGSLWRCGQCLHGFGERRRKGRESLYLSWLLFLDRCKYKRAGNWILRQSHMIFSHIQENMYTSAFSIFAGGSSFRWVRDTLCKDLLEKEDPYRVMTEEIRELPPGSNGVIFNPSLAGGTSQDKSVNIRGAFLGLNLGTGRAELVHAAMEGIAMNLKLSLDELERHAELEKGIEFCGGGAKIHIGCRCLQMYLTDQSSKQILTRMLRLSVQLLLLQKQWGFLRITVLLRSFI